jgi:hypothetical protein
VTLQFNSAYSATLTLPDSRQIPLVRFGFGVNPPVLTAFTPAAGAAPEALLTVNGTGFDPSGVVTLNLSDSTGYSVTIPAAAVASSSINVSVPPYIVASTSAFGSGTVNLTATQKSKGVSLTSNTLTGFNIQTLPKAQGTAGNSTLALIQADLAEAQKLQTSIAGTAQNTPAVAAAITQQVTNLQGLVTNIQNVVQNGQSYSLGTVGGVDITVTPTNISDVDSLILAALQVLANPASGSLLKSAQAAPSPACFSAEASAFVNSIAAGSSNLPQLAQEMLEAPTTSSACNTATSFASAYQIFGGAADVGLAIANGNGGGVVGSKLPGIALFAATSDNASAAVGLNALTSPQLSTEVTAVQTAIANVAAQSDPTANQLVAKSTGAVAANVSGAQTVTTTTTGNTPSGIQKAKNLVNALNSDAALITGPNSPPAILSSFSAQLDSISSSIQSIREGGASPVTMPFANGTVSVSGVAAGSSTTFTVVVTPTGGGSYTSVWAIPNSISGTAAIMASGQVTGNLMPVSTGAAATSITGDVAINFSHVPNSTSTVTLSNFEVSTTNNGAGSAESITLSNVAFSTVRDANGNKASGSANGTLTITIGSATYSITIAVIETANPRTSGSITMSYSGPNGAFDFSDVTTISGTMETDVWSVSQGTINIGGTFGPFDNTMPAPPFPTTFNVYDGTTQIGTFSGKTVSFIDGTFITFSF